ncbi:MAG: efflux RND transporter periplasmic adaptor subunit [Betaproteobacteria bacterium]|nr:efflux RND transporter periplasmic adaptor subunit [Betaproteobacteria bacterium]
MTSRQFLTITLVSAGFVAAVAVSYWAGRHQAGPLMNADAPRATTAAQDPMTDPETGRKVLYWHDPMVPGQKFDKPGKSPFMDMDLVPVYADEATTGGVAISPNVAQILGIRTAEARTANLAPPVEAVGTVAENERSLHVVQSRVNGYVEKLFVRANLDPVKAGQPVAEIFAPDWVAAQDEYLALRRAHAEAALVDAARHRLDLLSIPDSVVRAAETADTAQSRFTLHAPAPGIVTELAVREGAMVTPGMTLLRVVDLRRVWIHAEVPEQAAEYVSPSTVARVRPAGYPDRELEGRVETILPKLSPETRTLRLRIDLPNPDEFLKPGMITSVSLQPASPGTSVVIPSESVIPTGRRTVVIVQDADGRFAPVEVETGRESGGEIEIRKGLSPGQKVVVSGQFLIDSEASLKSVLPRLDTRDEANAGSGPHGVGTVDEIADGELTLAHEPIPSLKWPAMTMPFIAPAAVVPPGLRVGDRVKFSMKDAGDGEWELTRIEIVRDTGTQHAAAGPHGVGTVDDIADGELTLTHEPIPSLKWPAMTMPFIAPAGVVPHGLKVGDRVKFSMKDTGDGEWELTHVEIVDRNGAKP